MTKGRFPKGKWMDAIKHNPTEKGKYHAITVEGKRQKSYWCGRGWVLKLNWGQMPVAKWLKEKQENK